MQSTKIHVESQGCEFNLNYNHNHSLLHLKLGTSMFYVEGFFNSNITPVRYFNCTYHIYNLISKLNSLKIILVEP